MRYDRYKVSRDLSWEILLDEKIDELPIRIVKICKHMGIAVKTRRSLIVDGYSTVIGRKPVIYVSDEILLARQKFTIAHELGHILLGHIGKYKLINREPSPNDNAIEHEANVFASRLLAPACVLWGCNIYEVEDIANICEISMAAARLRAERMKILYKRGRFLTSPLERKVYSQFLPYIESHKL